MVTIPSFAEELSAWLGARFAAAFPDSHEAARAGRVVPSTKAGFGDFQCSDAMQLARPLRMPPRKIAEAALSGAALPDCVEKAEVAGAGYVNLTLKGEALAKFVNRSVELL